MKCRCGHQLPAEEANTKAKHNYLIDSKYFVGFLYSPRLFGPCFLGKAVLPNDLPYVTGAISLFGTDASHQLMADCDTLLMVGSGFPYAEFLPKEGQAHGVQIDLSVGHAGHHRLRSTLRHCGQVCALRAARNCLRGRRGHADERQRGTAHHSALLAAVAKSAAHHPGSQQPRPEFRDLPKCGSG